MEPTRHLELLRREGALLAAMPGDRLDAVVPSIPDWNLERVVRHVGKVHRWVVGALAAGPDGVAPAADGLPKGPDCLPAYAEALAEMVEVLERTPPDETAWTFIGPSAASFWSRRQAHEVAVHRIDAADAVHAAGGPAPEPLDADGAADAIDEWAELFLAVRYVQRFGALPEDLHGRALRLVTTDGGPDGGPTERRIELAVDGVTVVGGPAGGGPETAADVTVTGSAQDLLLGLWRRRPIDGLLVDGDGAVFDRLLDVARF
jgi:uncharacterized protein (TIGR03083 family)